MWLATRGEGTSLAWAQAAGWQSLADHQLAALCSLRTVREVLTEAWPAAGDGLAQRVTARLDDLIATTERLVAVAHANAAAARDIVGELAGARTDLGGAQDAWERVTGDWPPEWWASMAAQLNTEARERMERADAAVAELARAIVVPGGPPPPLDDVLPEPGPSYLPLATDEGAYRLPDHVAADEESEPVAAAGGPARRRRTGRRRDYAWEVARGPEMLERRSSGAAEQPERTDESAWDWVGDPALSAMLIMVRDAALVDFSLRHADL